VPVGSPCRHHRLSGTDVSRPAFGRAWCASVSRCPQTRVCPIRNPVTEEPYRALEKTERTYRISGHHSHTEKQKVADPDASPSRPSVRFTALAIDTTTSTAHTTHHAPLRAGCRWSPIG
jgi:hypothetical protein